MQALDLTGKTYGRWAVITKVIGTKKWLCKCTCGTQKEVLQCNLTTGKTTSCGCLKKELQTKHGDVGTSLYQVWCDLKQRCTNPKIKNYHNYGGRGITYTPEWETYIPFKKWAEGSGYQEDLQIDRIDNNKGYFPENCRWTSISINLKNKRKSLNTSSKYRGVYYAKDRNKWVAQVNITKEKIIKIGEFTDEVSAAKARDAYILKESLSDLHLNFT